MAHLDRMPRPNSQPYFGGISVLAWGLSVVGTLVWEDFGIVSSTKWNSWFNFFAAGFAATAVGCSAK
jgi:hypothetical protein